MGRPDLTVHVTDRQLSALGKGMKMSAIRGAMDELEKPCRRKMDAAEDFAKACKLQALQGGVDAVVLSTYVTARVNDTLEKKQNQAEQLQILFEEV